LEKFSLVPSAPTIFIFGGYDENGKASNDLYLIDFGYKLTTFNLSVLKASMTKVQLTDDENGQVNPIRLSQGKAII